MTPKAQAFVKANDKSKVIGGSATGNGGQGGVYTLANGKWFQLSLEDCRSLPNGYPVWDLS